MKRTSAAWPTWVDKIYFGDVTKTTNVSRVRDTKRTTTDASSSRVPESCKPPARVWRGQVRSCVVHAHALARGLDLRVDACVRGRRRDSRNRRYFSHAGRTVACRPGAPRRLPSRDTRDEATSFVIYDPSRAREAHPGRVYPLRRPRLPRDARPRPPRPRPGKPPVPDRRRDRRRRTLPRPETPHHRRRPRHHICRRRGRRPTRRARLRHRVHAHPRPANLWRRITPTSSTWSSVAPR